MIVGVLFVTIRPAHAKKLPPIQSAQDAMMQLRLKGEQNQLAALKNLKSACSGRYRRAIKDAPSLTRPLASFSKSGTDAVKKATMDAYRCFSPTVFAELIKIQIVDPDPSIVSYAAEVSARVSDPAMLPALIQELEKQQASCMKPGLTKAETNRCVWLTYAPGACAKNAAKEMKTKLAQLAIFHFDSPYPKVREVAVETLSATKVAAQAPALRLLIKKEKKGHFSTANDKALITRFEKRLKALKRSN